MTTNNIERLLQIFRLYGIDYQKENFNINELLLLDDEILKKVDVYINSKIRILKIIRECLLIINEKEQDCKLK